MVSLAARPPIPVLRPLCVPILAACSAVGGGQAQVPAPGELNPHILRIFAGYPKDGSYAYWWPKGSDWEGTTRDLDYMGTRVARGDPRHRSYCCGLTFEVFFQACEAWCRDRSLPFRIGDLDGKTMVAFRRAWYGSDGDRRTLWRALVDYRLGTPVEKLEGAKAGDFVQFWRRSGSGHSAIFLGWERREGKIVGLRYGSSQGSTKGVGVAVESFEGEKGVDPAQVYLVRAGRQAR